MKKDIIMNNTQFLYVSQKLDKEGIPYSFFCSDFKGDTYYIMNISNIIWEKVVNDFIDLDNEHMGGKGYGL